MLLLAAACPSTAPGRGEAPKPASADPNRIINASYAFLRDREPAMTEVEMAIYEKVVPMVAAQPEFALTLLEGMVAEQDTSAAFEFVLANAYYEQKRFADAETRFKAAVAKFPTFVRAWDNLGVLYFSTDRYAEAVPCFTRVLALGSTEPRIFGLLAFCQLKTGNTLAAESSYLQAYSRDPDNPDWLEGLLSSYLEAGEQARAESLLRRLVRLRPTEPRFWVLLAGCLHAQDRPIEAIGQLEAARSLAVLDPDGMATLGDLCAEQKLFAEAVRAYTEAAATRPAVGAGRLANLARALAGERRYDEALDVLEAGGTVEHGDARLLLQQVRAEIHLARQEWAPAAQLFDEVVGREPMNASALVGLGSALEALGDDAGALVAYESAARLGEQSYAASLKLANLQVKLHRYESALTALDQALAVRRSPELVDFQARVRALAAGRP